jgi:phage gp29-like protein
VLLASTERDGGTLTTTANDKTAVKTVSVGNITSEARLRGCFEKDARNLASSEP